MAAKNTKTGKAQQKGVNETQRWVIGILLFVFALYLFAAVVSYYFYWADDQSFVLWDEMMGPRSSDVQNPTGKTGAVMAHYIVGQWFGVFGVVIPIVLGIFGLRIVNYRPAVLRKSVRISLVLMILGSLSLGFLFGMKWGVFGTGLGGAHGIVVAEWIRSLLGTIGTALLLLLGWVLLGVYINRRTIKVVNKVGHEIVEGGVKIGEAVKGRASTRSEKRELKKQEKEEKRRLKEELAVLEEEEQKRREHSGESVTEEIGKTVNTSKADKDIEIIRPDGEEEEYDGGDIIIDDRDIVTVIGVDGGTGEVSSTVFVGGEQQAISQEEDPNVIIFGHEAERIVTINDRYAGVIEPSEPGSFEVVDRSGQPLSVGGVVETVSAGDGINPGDGLQVVVAGHSEAIVADDELDNDLYDPTLELSKYQRPPVEILEDHSITVEVTEDEVRENKDHIVQTLLNFGIRIDKIKATIGPTVTLYEIVPAAGVKISKIKNLEDDIALSLKALGIRIIAPMPGKGTVGIEVPNKDKEIVSMYSLVKTRKFQESDYELPIVLGKTISNELFMIDLAKMPHLLVAGATGQGKSVGLNAIIASLLYRKHPGELKFVMVDPKRVELSLYSKLEKHFLAKMESEDEAILTDTQKVVYTLNALVKEMSDRYDLLRMGEVKKISEYNEKFKNRRLNPRKGHRFLPYIVVIVDEFADMIMTAGREVEAPITRLAQLARAVGIHLVIATQRPDVKVITGLIKANFPARIAFRVMSMVDSRTIIDQPGANHLIGRGDMLMSLNGDVTRVQCAFIDTPEIERITEFIGNQRGYASAYPLPDYYPDAAEGGESRTEGPVDPMFEEVARYVVQQQSGSTSSIQRRFSIGYNRAGRIMDQLEDAGVVGRAEGSKPREVLITDVGSLEYILQKMLD